MLERICGPRISGEGKDFSQAIPRRKVVDLAGSRGRGACGVVFVEFDLYFDGLISDVRDIDLWCLSVRVDRSAGKIQRSVVRNEQLNEREGVSGSVDSHGSDCERNGDESGW